MRVDLHNSVLNLDEMQPRTETFESVRARSRRGIAQIATPLGYVGAAAWLIRGIAIIQFDWFLLNYKLSPSVWARLKDDWQGIGLGGGVSTLSADVRAEEAHEWF